MVWLLTRSSFYRFQWTAYSRLQPWLATLVVAGLAASAVVFVGFQSISRYRVDLTADFVAESRERGILVQAHLAKYRQALLGVRSYLVSHGQISKEEWARYVQSLSLKSELPGVRGIGINAMVSAASRPEHEEKVRANGFPDYRLQVQAGASHYAPVIRHGGQAQIASDVIGVDFFAAPALKQTMLQSAASASTRISSLVQLPWMHDPDKTAAHVVMFEPLMGVGNSESEPIDRVRGWVFLYIDVRELLISTLGTPEENTALEVILNRDRAHAYIAGNQTLASPGYGALSQRYVPLDFQVDVELVFYRAANRVSPVSWLSGELTVVTLIGILAVMGTAFITQARLQSKAIQEAATELKESEERYRHMATHDPLTKVANRTLLLSRLDTAVAEALRYDRIFALMYFDLDKFKAVNDGLGHHCGDQLLVQVAQRTSSLLRGTDLLARNGGDEFVVLLPSVESSVDAETVAQKICGALSIPFDLSGKTANISSSIGIALFPLDARDVDSLVNCADVNMYRAKKAGGNQWYRNTFAKTPIGAIHEAQT